MSIGCMFGLKHVCKNARDITICLKKMSVLRATHLDRWQSTLAWLRATDGSRLTLSRKEPKKHVFSKDGWSFGRRLFFNMGGGITRCIYLSKTYKYICQ